MPMRAVHGCVFALLLILALGGCSEKPTTPVNTGNAPGGTSADDAAKVPDAPDAAIRAVIDGMQQHRPDALWRFLPESYQRDVNDVVHEFANRMDPEIWNRTMAVLRKAARVVKSQKELIREAMGPQPRPGGPPVPPPLDLQGIAELIDTLVKSDLGNLDKLKTADAGDFLKTTGGQFLKQMQALSQIAPPDSLSLRVDEMSKVKVRLVSQDQDTAVVQLEPPGGEPTEAEFVRVEGKWIPRDLADGWIEGIGQAKARLALLSSENLAELKPRLLTLLGEFDQALDQLGTARNKEQFGAALQGLVMPGMMLAMLAQALPGDADDSSEAETDASPPSLGPRASADLVTLVVRGKLSTGASDDLREKLQSALESSDRPFLESTGDDELTSFKVGPVSDVEAFAKKLDFLKVVEVDVKTRTITATPVD